MNVDDRIRVAKEAGYVLLSQDDGQEIYGRDDLPSTVEFDGVEWTLQLRDFNLDPVAHQHLGDAAVRLVIRACRARRRRTVLARGYWSRSGTGADVHPGRLSVGCCRGG